jgi:hypothetical protein
MSTKSNAIPRSERRAALQPWLGPDPGERDVRKIVLAYALLAINPHNIQPWKVQLPGDGEIMLYLDHDRLFPEGDPFHRQVHIAQGTFLENLVIAASHHGFRANVTYFPLGSYEEVLDRGKPVAHVKLVRDPTVVADPLFPHIVHRQCNRRNFGKKGVGDEVLQGLLGQLARATGSALHLSNDPDRTTGIGYLLQQAILQYVADPSTYEESWRMVRFNDDEVERLRDGLTAETAGVTGVAKFLKERVITRARARSMTSLFAKVMVQASESMVSTARAYGWITGGNRRLDQVLMGRDYQRLCLACTRLGVAHQPIGEILVEQPFMADTQRALYEYLRIPEGQTLHIIFRLGYAKPVAHAPRRPVATLIAGA